MIVLKHYYKAVCSCGNDKYKKKTLKLLSIDINNFILNFGIEIPTILPPTMMKNNYTSNNYFSLDTDNDMTINIKKTQLKNMIALVLE